MATETPQQRSERLIQAQYHLIEKLRESEERFRTLIESLPQQLWTASADGALDYANQQMCDYFDQPLNDLVSTGWADCVHPDDQQSYQRHHIEALKTGQCYELDLRLRNGGGRYRWHFAKVLPLRDESGALAKWVGSLTDITERKEAEDVMRLSSLVYQNSSEAMMVTEADGTIVDINPSFTRITGYERAEVLGRKPSLLKSGHQSPAFYKKFWAALNTQGGWQGEMVNKRKNGEEYIQRVTINSTYNDDGSILHHVALLQDITEQKQNEKLIWQQANFDQLTGLPNRRMFVDRLEQDVKKAQRTKTKVGLLYLDLDNFKEVNDTLGHEAGDELLKIAAQRLTECVREVDTVARLGGDEFVVILGNIINEMDIERVANAILDALQAPFDLNDELAYVSASIGITIFPDDGARPELLLKNADQAMYSSKQAGRNQLSYFTVSLEEAAQNRRRIGNDLRVAVAEQQFWLAYQPIVHLASGAIHKAEALLRWQHPEKGLYSPADFIPVAEETGIIVKIGDWVFRQAAQQVKLWRQKLQPDFQVSINKSPVQFQQSDSCHTRWLAYLQELNLSGRGVTIEITESLLLDASEAVGDMLLAYSDAGIDISLDDFGTGYSSLAYLQQYDVDSIKIDQSFVRELAEHPKKIVLCKSIILMAHELGMQVVAEGIETEEQRKILLDMGCDYGQGYLFSKPLPAEQFEKLIQATSDVGV